MFAKSYAHRSYPTNTVPSDTQLLLEFLAEFFPKIEGARTLLDLASGPVVSQVCSAAPFTQSIIMSDISRSNLQVLRSWQKNQSSDADFKNWNTYTEFSLRCEGRLNPSLEDINKRETEVRTKIKSFIELDIRKPFIQHVPEPVDAISCFFGTEAAASSCEEWVEILRNITQCLRPDGHLLLSLVAESDSYLFVDINNGCHRVKITNINETQIFAGLRSVGFTSDSLIVKRLKFSGFESEGYDTIFLVYARKNGLLGGSKSFDCSQ
jgi:hypothetical protein